MASFEVLTDTELVSLAEEKGAYIQSKLKHPLIKEIRRVGLFFAIEMANADQVQQVVLGSKEKGLLSYWFLSCPESFRIAPPLVATFEEIDQACAIILETMDEVDVLVGF